MASPVDMVSPDVAEQAPHDLPDATMSSFEVPSTPTRVGRRGMNGSADLTRGVNPVLSTPVKTLKRAPLKKKVPWKGKNIIVSIPLDETRGQPGKAPVPLTRSEVDGMYDSWEELGYDIQGFDLKTPSSYAESGEYSQSRGAWPDFDELVRERAQRNYKVTLPDLNAWKKYVDELNEAKLRALGVSFGDDDPPAPSISPVSSAMSRQASVTHYPLPFSPPLPTSSASSNHVAPGFPFSGAFASLPGQSPGIPNAGSPISFLPKGNPRASISVSSPSWSQQFLSGHRGGSPSLANFSSMMSPTSQFAPEGFSPAPMHQRHQSLQYPMLQHQFQQPTRATPRLQDLREDEEEEGSKSPSKTPEPTSFMRHNASDSLQQEIDEAEYHLEEQMRSQLDNDQDYSPHNENDQPAEMGEPGPEITSHMREPSVQFAPQPPLFTAQAEGHVLHHPRPHSRGHSLSQKYFTEEDANHHKSPYKSQPLRGLDSHVAEESELETNPSNLGTPIEPASQHQRSFSTASNPWADNESSKPFSGSRRSSHASKASLSKLNVDAPEFKFNPTSSFKPGQFSFSGSSSSFSVGNSFQPMVFNAGLNEQPAPPTNHFGLPTSHSMPQMNAAASVFSPGQSDFSFSSSGPTLQFRPDAPAFTPVHSFSNSLTSPMMSGVESNRGSSIFGNIDLSGSEMVKPTKKSKAIPIVRPVSRHSHKDEGELHEGPDGRISDMTRVKRFRGSAGDDDDVPRFAEGHDEVTPVPESIPKAVEDESLLEDKSAGEESFHHADTTALSSTMVSETTDPKPTTSPSEISPDQGRMNWTPFEFESKADLQDFNMARPFGEDVFKRGHKKSLSATAKDFVPGATLWGPAAAAEETAGETEDELAKELMGDLTTDDFTGEVPVGEERVAEVPLAKSIEVAMEEPIYQAAEEPAPDRVQESVEEAAVEPIQVKLPAVPSPVSAPRSGGLSGSRFATTPAQATPVAKGLSASRYASDASPPPTKRSGLSASRFAASPSPVHDDELVEAEPFVSPLEESDAMQPTVPLPADNLPLVSEDERVEAAAGFVEPSMEDIDAIMRHLNQNPSMGINKTAEPQPQWHQPSPVRNTPLAAITNESHFRMDSPSPGTQQYHEPAFHAPQVPQPILSTEPEDPFVDPPPSLPLSAQSFTIHHRQPEQVPGSPSDWEGEFSEDEQAKLESRVTFFDGHVNGLVDGLLAARLDPLENTLDSIKQVLAVMTRRTPSSRRDRRSMSAEIQESDADDEDDDMPRRSMSPRRDKKMEQIRAAVLDAFATQQRNLPLQTTMPSVAAAAAAPTAIDDSTILKAIDALKEQFEQSLHLDFRGEDLRNIVEDAVEKRMPQTPQPAVSDEMAQKVTEMQARVAELEQRLRQEEGKVDREFAARTDAEDRLRLELSKVESELAARRAAEEKAAELSRQLQNAETRIEVEIMNKSIFDQRVVDLEERLHQEDTRVQDEINGRRAAEDRLSEVQRLLRISSEEEDRLRDAVEERDQKIKALEANHGKSSMRLALLEAGQANSQQLHSEFQNKLNNMEGDLRKSRQELSNMEGDLSKARQDADHWQAEARRIAEVARRHDEEAAQLRGENKALHKLIDTLGVQLQEVERVRDAWRTKLATLQEEMTNAAREITEENARRAKKEQALIARQEVLDARLQAEARTRERIETELERLEQGERQGMRAVSECKRLEGLLAELRTENHKLQQTANRYQAEFQEARESGAREVQRTRDSMQADLEAANHQVNVVRQEFEDQAARLRAQLDQVKLDADTAKAHHDMLLEEAQNSKASAIQELERKHEDEIDDLQARYERQLSNKTEDAQRAEQNLLERLSISTSKTEYLQDKVAHLEEKLDIARAAAQAAAQAAKSSITSPSAVVSPTMAAMASAPAPAPAPQPKAIPQHLQLPEKISPQALRESIMVLQEQLQAKEQDIESLEAELAKMDPEASTKISKRDDEITWLRELLAVRHSDLQDIIAALSRNDYDRHAVKDAAIRLKANLQMEEQERERAMNGGSAITLPNIAATIRDATPRVAQAVGPLAAAWGNWRKSTGVLSSPAPAGNSSNGSNTSTPAKSGSSTGFSLGGLLTPPASGLRQTPPNSMPNLGSGAQPTAFSSTGRRFTPQDLANRPKPAPLGMPTSASARAQGKMPARGQTLSGPVTPPMMRPSAYDDDATAGDFDDAGFFDDD